MVGAASVIQFLQAGLLYQALGAYVAQLSAERGWSKTALSGGAALQALEAAILGPVLGWVIDRFGTRAMIQLGVAMFGTGFILLSRIDSLAGFYGALIVIALGSSLCGFFPLNVAVINWFRVKRARALSTVALGLALGGTFVPIVAWSMQAWGWRTTALASGLVFLVVGLPLASVFRTRPEDHGQTLDGIPPETTAAVAPPAASPPNSAGAPAAAVESIRSGKLADEPDFTARDALRTRAFWLLGLGHGFALLVVTAVNVHAISHMTNVLGYTLAQASYAITAMTLFQVVGVGVGFWCGDRFQKRRVAAACMIGHALGLIALTYADTVWMIAVFAISHGIAWGLRGPFMQAIRADYFGRRAIGKIMGMSSLIVVIGQIGGPLVAGAFYDWQGDYEAGFNLLAAIAATGAILFMLARPPTPRAPA